MDKIQSSFNAAFEAFAFDNRSIIIIAAQECDNNDSEIIPEILSQSKIYSCTKCYKNFRTLSEKKKHNRKKHCNTWCLKEFQSKFDGLQNESQNNEKVNLIN